MHHDFRSLVTAYLDTLKGRASHPVMVRVARPWINTLTATPTRAQIFERHLAKGHGHFQHGAVAANSELALMKAAFRWGLYQDCWQGGDPTKGIKKWKRPRRKTICKLDEIRLLLRYFDCTVTEAETRDRALFGMQLFTGCRPSEARTARVEAITPYGEMGCWNKGQTKTGEDQEIPLPWQAMEWIAAWKKVRPYSPGPYLFPGFALGKPGLSSKPITETGMRLRWAMIRAQLGLTGLWNYDLRRTMACYLGNELHYDDHTIRTILNHFDGTALGHYYFKPFDSLIKPIQEYADWLCALNTQPASTLDAPAEILLIEALESEAMDMPG